MKIFFNYRMNQSIYKYIKMSLDGGHKCIENRWIIGRNIKYVYFFIRILPINKN